MHFVRQCDFNSNNKNVLIIASVYGEAKNTSYTVDNLTAAAQLSGAIIPILNAALYVRTATYVLFIVSVAVPAARTALHEAPRRL